MSLTPYSAPEPTSVNETWKWKPLRGKRTREDEDDTDSDQDQFVKYCKLEHAKAVLEASRPLRCYLSPACSSTPPFTSVALYECHYASAHVNVCAQCHRIMPTTRILDLHLMEYECFVDGCPTKENTYADRNAHMANVHDYPPEFYFDVVKYGQHQSGSKKSYWHDKRRVAHEHRARRRADAVAKKEARKMSEDVDQQSEAHNPVPMATEDDTAEPPKKSGKQRSKKPKKPKQKAGTSARDESGQTEEVIPSENIAMEPDMDVLTAAMAQLNIPKLVSFGRGMKPTFRTAT
ncbi:hypothetical protein HKX48_005466 [Thoreauomyces humboldtii]|nr:hypothetical protein HKX48_005466 [Thoreauomyces humboldtii]